MGGSADSADRASRIFANAVAFCAGRMEVPCKTRGFAVVVDAALFLECNLPSNSPSNNVMTGAARCLPSWQLVGVSMSLPTRLYSYQSIPFCNHTTNGGSFDDVSNSRDLRLTRVLPTYDESFAMPRRRHKHATRRADEYFTADGSKETPGFARINLCASCLRLGMELASLQQPEPLLEAKKACGQPINPSRCAALTKGRYRAVRFS